MTYKKDEPIGKTRIMLKAAEYNGVEQQTLMNTQLLLNPSIHPLFKATWLCTRSMKVNLAWINCLLNMFIIFYTSLALIKTMYSFSFFRFRH